MEAGAWGEERKKYEGGSHFPSLSFLPQEARYCGTGCQQKDWPVHKRRCRERRRDVGGEGVAAAEPGAHAAAAAAVAAAARAAAARAAAALMGAGGCPDR